jgi:hypothetical protein
MAINVNTVYTTVLSILNKEQRGYITPYEFNQLATQVQLEIFERFFEDYNQYLRMPRTNVEFASRIEHIRNEFEIFQKSGPSVTIPAGSSQTDNVYLQPTDLHRFGSVNYNKGFNSPEIEIVSARDYTEQTLSPLTTPTSDFPIAKYKENKITVFPTVTNTYSSSDVTFNYIRKPKDVVWGYTVGTLGQYVYSGEFNILYKFITSANLLPLVTQMPSFSGGSVSNFLAKSDNPLVTTDGLGTDFSIRVITTLPPIGNPVLTTLTVVDTGNRLEPGDTITIDKSLFAASGAALSDVIITIDNTVLNTASSAYSQDFEISDSQQTEVILEILKYSGIIIRDPSVVQAASQLIVSEEANTKR